MTRWIKGLIAVFLWNVAHGYHTGRVLVVQRQQAGLRLWGTEPKVPNGLDALSDPPSVSVSNDPKLPSAPPPVVRDTEFGRMARGIARTGMKNVESLQVGDVVVAKYEIPSLNIWIDSGYEIIELYSQGVNAMTGQVEKLPLTTLSATISKTGYTTYLKVYSPKYHSAPVVVTADEMGLITIKAELVEAMMLAIPGLFWVIVASSFASYYNGKYGGNFLDAFFRT